MSEEPEVKSLPPSDRSKWILFSVVTVLSLVADQITKIWARANLPVIGHGTGSNGVCVVPHDIMSGMCRGEAKHVLGGFWDWRLSMNPGSAFGLFAGTSFARVLLSLVGIAAVIGMLVMLRKSRPDQKVLHWALALVAGGAIGNLIDRIYYGVVTDFILWHYNEHEWPVFNVADVVLVIGVGLMFIDIQKENKRTGKKKTKAERAAAMEKAKAAGLVKKL